MNTPPTLILLPGGLCVSGVAVWAARLANALTEQGTDVALTIFAPHPGHRPLSIALDERLTRIDLTHLPPIESAGDNLAPYIAPIAQHILTRARPEQPMAVIPNLHGDCFGVVAAIAQVHSELIRVIGVAHSDNTYDAAIITHYSPMLAHAVAVSDHLEAELRSKVSIPIANVPYGVPIPNQAIARQPTANRPIKLLYAGRLEHRQKRIMALPVLSDALNDRQIAHTLTIVGAGPARNQLARELVNRPNITMRDAVDPTALGDLLDSHDAFVLPSRYEGLSIAMLEALAHGCIPIVARSRSGSAQAISTGITGEIVDIDPDADETETGIALARAVETLTRRDLPEMANRAAVDARRRFSLEAHVRAWQHLLGSAVNQPPKPWPADRPAAYSSSQPGAGSVPIDAGQRLIAILAKLAGRPIIIHGAGRHTLALAPLLDGFDIRAVADDDPQRFGERLLGWKIIDPHTAAVTGATDVIISSALHEADIWRRREVYVEQGLRVHRLYAATDESHAATKP
ncbi:MAG TPA: glycosyltransferase [Phycisphaerales bacterium]|nr:glycosyltransferase [Phycisphaerales bacterium]